MIKSNRVLKKSVILVLVLSLLTACSWVKYAQKRKDTLTAPIEFIDVEPDEIFESMSTDTLDERDFRKYRDSIRFFLTKNEFPPFFYHECFDMFEVSGFFRVSSHTYTSFIRDLTCALSQEEKIKLISLADSNRLKRYCPEMFRTENPFRKYTPWELLNGKVECGKMLCWESYEE